MMACYRPRSSGTTTDIVTYRYNGDLVYVPVAPSYSQALTHARDAFPQLRKQRDTSISLSLTAPGQQSKFVGISALAWPKLVTHLSRYQIIDVHVAQHERDVPVSIPEITITYADAEGAEEPVPPYQSSFVSDDEKASYAYPRTLSASSLHPAKRNWFFQKLQGQ